MPYPDSEYPSVLRGKDKRESQRLMAAAPEMLAALKAHLPWHVEPVQGWGAWADAVKAIAKADGRE
jgi:hypothetical protein